MRFCTNCGREIAQGSAFCGHCGTAAGNEPVPATTSTDNRQLDREELEFLNNTHQLLRWEMKAWSIASKAFLIMGIVFAALFMLIALIGAVGGAEGAIVFALCFVYAILYGGIFIGLGVVSKKACEKLPLYINTVHTDLSLAYNRCGNVGMLVFTALFGVVSPVFFIINFVRMKANHAVIESIMSKQRMGG